ncbi:DUF3858 domain-containing protein [Microvirga sp. GCM10011540]|uniref:DUF3858 domain-containing protein n=1 Tax=Microvirga sp. GCM10011540 TaxID=3317338 RepID=UPI0036194C05
MLSPDGMIAGSKVIGTSGRADTVIRSAVANARSPQDLATRLISQSPEGGFGVVHADNPRSLATVLSLKAEWTSPHGVVMTGKTVPFSIPVGIDFLPYQTFRQYLSASGERRYPIIVGSGVNTWTYDIGLPDGYSLDSVPPASKVENSAGLYTATYEASEDRMRVSRRLTINKDIYEPDEYPALQALLYALIDDARSSAFVTRR